MSNIQVFVCDNNRAVTIKNTVLKNRKEAKNNNIYLSIHHDYIIKRYNSIRLCYTIHYPTYICWRCIHDKCVNDANWLWALILFSCVIWHLKTFWCAKISWIHTKRALNTQPTKCLKCFKMKKKKPVNKTKNRKKNLKNVSFLNHRTFSLATTCKI